ncbi:hypothetical protein ACVWWG_007976 [Bradyrhizobium sp. LB7.2]
MDPEKLIGFLSSRKPLVIERRAGNRFDPLDDEPEWLVQTTQPLLAAQVELPETLIGNTKGLALLRRAPDVTVVRAAQWHDLREGLPVGSAKPSADAGSKASERHVGKGFILFILATLMLSANIAYLGYQAHVLSVLRDEERDFRKYLRDQFQLSSELSKKQSDELSGLRFLLTKNKRPRDDRSGSKLNSDSGLESRPAQ